MLLGSALVGIESLPGSDIFGSYMLVVCDDGEVWLYHKAMVCDSDTFCASLRVGRLSTAVHNIC